LGGEPSASQGGSNAGEGGAAGNGVPLVQYLGRGCTRNSACGPDLTCLTFTNDFIDGEGAPAGGLCTTSCTSDADCHGIDARAVCGSFSEPPLTSSFATEMVPRVCLLGCDLGAVDGAPKCQNRSDLACRPFAPTDSVACEEDGTCPSGTVCFRARCRELACGPRCNSNDDCAPGRSCHPYTGLCVEGQVEQVPLGQDCNDLPSSPSCGDGNCLALFDDDGRRVKGMCTQSCTLGQVCGEDKGACIMPRFSDFSVGDIAYCQPTCNCDADCLNPNDRCFPWGSPLFEERFGTRGVCDYDPEPVGTLVDCSSGGAGGGGSGGDSGAAGASESGGAGGAGGAH
jgi:hypothetical protein